MIKYARGKIEVLDVEALRESSCESVKSGYRACEYERSPCERPLLRADNVYYFDQFATMLAIRSRPAG